MGALSSTATGILGCFCASKCRPCIMPWRAKGCSKDTRSEHVSWAVMLEHSSEKKGDRYLFPKTIVCFHPTPPTCSLQVGVVLVWIKIAAGFGVSAVTSWVDWCKNPTFCLPLNIPNNTLAFLDIPRPPCEQPNSVAGLFLICCVHFPQSVQCDGCAECVHAATVKLEHVMGR